MSRSRPVAGYYADLTEAYLGYGRDASGWHYGLSEEGVKGHVGALLRSNEVLLRGLQIGPATRVLDVGCGGGGFAVWAAKKYGCRVTGITICHEHIDLAMALAREQGVSSRCRFLVMDMNELAFPGECFDVVTNQDTFCYSEPEAYLKQVFRVLVPGGHWRAVAFSIQDEPLSPRQKSSYGRVRDGFHIPSLSSVPHVQKLLEGLAFVEIETRDVTAETHPTARHIIGASILPLLLRPLRLDWVILGRAPGPRANRLGHFRAGMAYSMGLLRGYMRHGCYSAARPTAP